jgi:hypothetical protein
MQKLLSTLLFFMLLLSASAQNFEGRIIYQNTYQSKIPQLTDQQLTEMMGNRQQYLVKSGNYKSLTNGTLVQWQLYLQQDNKLYNKLVTSETILFNDGSVNKDEVLSFELNKGVTEVLGNKCDELILRCKSGVQKYYFCSRYAMDASLYKNHQFANWYTYLSKAGALPLKQVVESKELIVESIAVEITPMQLSDSDFQLPPGTKTAQTPY